VYLRKTSNAEELSAARSRASLARKTHGGGRPRLAENDRPGRSVRVAAADFDVLAAFACAQKVTLKGAVHLLMRLLVKGGSSVPHSDYAPCDWRF